ncbi:hypothetical protein M409DRAFT_18492 [Zasmidium cellare ATCC 36951]|uniref:2EXR domain-containing protein n=1 Tax=Zasmidium cellare ATCC 36951 TaxID=1080233 RepID=A0A6A6D151_ZASCE|nr:uncharacterized protein M409DRAFT_18492 [Zasmidium cellare ATCC 36951]KAF2171376.1 hypothetical protein M409DRAFT_18492 [Zasmidium cellare ATCC 36951]
MTSTTSSQPPRRSYVSLFHTASVAVPSSRKKKEQPQPTKEDDGPKNTKDTTKKPYRLFELPAELRHTIYELALTDETRVHLVYWPAHLLRTDPFMTAKPGPEADRAREVFSSVHPLTQVNKQIRSEALSMATMMAPVLKVTIRDFDFTRLMFFFDHFRLEDLQMFRPHEDPWPRLTVKLISATAFLDHENDSNTLAIFTSRVRNAKMNTPHQHTTASEDSKECLLLKLPAELRNTIYRMAIGANRTVRLLQRPQKVQQKQNPKPGPLLTNLTTFCALAQVNRQIRSEHKEMFTNKKEGGTPRFVVELVFSFEYNDKDREDHPGFDAWFTRPHGVSRASQVLFDYAPMQHPKFRMVYGNVDAYEKSGIRNVHDFRLLTSRLALARSRL